jgi:alcohol dehydrogenase (cytochrome c)
MIIAKKFDSHTSLSVLLLDHVGSFHAIAAVALAFIAALAPAVVAQKGPIDGGTRADWPHYGGTQSAWRYSALDQINTTNVMNLSPVWMFQTGEYNTDGLTSTPIVVDGVMYISTTRNQAFALDAATGHVIWNYKYMTRPNYAKPGSQGSLLNRGVAVGDGKVFMGTVDSYLVAIDQKTGREIWKVAVDDSRQCGCRIMSAPLVVKDKVIVGEDGGDDAFRGYLTAFYAKTGRVAWRFYVIPAPGETGNETWKDDSWKYGGGAPWMTGSYDPDLDLVYWGTGNAASDFYDSDRVVGAKDDPKGVNLYTASVVALEADTGKLRWAYQEIPDDEWDFDSAYEVILIDREVNGRWRRLLVHMNKSGITFVLDRVTGQFVKAFTVPEVQTWISGITEDGKLIGRQSPGRGKPVTLCPGPAGAKSWNQMAYSPRTGYIYTPTIEVCSETTANRAEPREGIMFSGGSASGKLPTGRDTISHIDAFDPLTGKRVWTVPYKYVLMASMLTTAGDLVFTGDPEGNFFALNSRTGEKLWNFQTGAGHRGSAISYSVDGRQYVATPTGWQQSMASAMLARLFPGVGETWRIGSTITVFALPEGSK